MQIIDGPELTWDFDGRDPYVKYGEGWGRVIVDPFPCYGHDAELVEHLANQAYLAAPIVEPPSVYLLHHECLSRVNGWAEQYSNVIVLSGKRIPLHPAMTRYLVPHEYGHAVEYELDRIADEDGATLDEYIKLRPGASSEYGALKWDSCIAELFANDFRILICEEEIDFWPHPNFPHPHDIKRRLKRFWKKSIDTLKENNQ